MCHYYFFGCCTYIVNLSSNRILKTENGAATHYIEVDVTGLIMIEYKLNLFVHIVHNSTLPLDIRKRVVRFGKV